MNGSCLTILYSCLSINRKGWQGRHRLALIFGTLLAWRHAWRYQCRAARLDKIEKLILDLVALILLVLLV